MNIPDSIQERVKKEINLFCNHLPEEPNELYEPMRYMLSLGGKNLRPSLLLLTCKMLGGKVNDAIPAAIAMELFHNFTLIHDDVTDNSPLRRGKPTVYKKWNLNVALLSGDALLIKSYQELNKTKAKYLPVIFQVFNDAALKVCEGQQFDMNYEIKNKVTIVDYLNMISMKTAALFSASMGMGAMLAGASKSDINKMKVTGESLGMLFQLKDDMLDVFGESAQTGKQIGGDIIQDKKTFLLLKALELAKGKTKAELNSLIGSTKISPKEKVERVKKIYEKLGVEEIANKQMEMYYSNAKKSLTTIKTKEKDILLALTGALLNRNK
ncbi:MAG TPA: polyprenyl synthetase family protein [Bacteroidia bacterium]|nr:polyprenyl synthetase family protein [Bacteroidia bacterium]